MKINPLLKDLITGEWLLDINFVSNAAPLLFDNFLKGVPLNLPGAANTSSILTIFDENGNKIKANEQGGFVIPEGAIAMVDMVGAVIKYGDYCTYGADEIVSALQKADDNRNIKAIILNIDGPGGAVSAIGPFQNFARTKTKPVIGLADACMSLHYWAAVQTCDYIMADNDVSARFGSVGVVSSFVDAKQHWEEKGYKFHDIYPEESKDKNLAFQQALKGDYTLIKQEHLAPIARKFQAAVRANRTGLKEEAGVLTGATFDADKALGLGMIDGIGGLKKAIEIAQVLSELKSIIN